MTVTGQSWAVIEVEFAVVEVVVVEALVVVEVVCGAGQERSNYWSSPLRLQTEITIAVTR